MNQILKDLTKVFVFNFEYETVGLVFNNDLVTSFFFLLFIEVPTHHQHVPVNE